MKYSYLRERIKAMAVQGERNGISRVTVQQAEVNSQALKNVVAKNGTSSKLTHAIDKSHYSISQSDIAARAFNIWINDGCPAGKEMEHWLEAERQLKIESSMSSH